MSRENQHFVPKAFLKNFCISGKETIYRSRFIRFTNKWESPVSKHISSICYRENFYNVSPEFAKKNEIPQNYVERNAFWYEKGFLDELIQKIENETIKHADTEKLPDFYLSMIVRNPVFMIGFNQDQIERLLDENLIKLRAESEWFEKLAKLKSNEELEKSLDNIRFQILKEQSQQNMYSTSVYKQLQGQSEIYNQIRNKLKGYKVLIGRIKDDNQFFITSDSPGFSVCLDGNIHSLKFKDDIIHYMPISSKIVITLQHPIYFFDPPRLLLTKVSLDEVKFINDGTAKVSHQNIFCESKEFLTNFISNKAIK